MAVPDYSPCYRVEGRAGAFLATDTRPHVKDFPRYIPGHIRLVGIDKREGNSALRQYLMTFGALGLVEDGLLLIHSHCFIYLLKRCQIS